MKLTMQARLGRRPALVLVELMEIAGVMIGIHTAQAVGHREPTILGGRRCRHPSRGIVDDVHATPGSRSMLVPIMWGLIFGAIQAASPLAARWLDHATVLALELVLIAAVYIGFAVADGRPRVIAVESVVAGLFVVLAATAITATAWLLVLGYTAAGMSPTPDGGPRSARQSTGLSRPS
jgi:hypothetical protein